MTHAEDCPPSDAASSDSTPPAASSSDAPAPTEASPPESAADTEPAAANEPAEAAKPASNPITLNLPAMVVVGERTDAEAEPAWSAPPDEPHRPHFLLRHWRLAAALAVATALGAIGGIATTTALLRDGPAPAATAAPANATLQDSLARLERELANVKTGVAQTQRSVGAQLGKLSERMDRAEKAQAEPSAKLAKIIESLDRVERRIPQAGVMPPAGAAIATAAAADATGSVAARNEPKQDAKPPLAEGWRLLDVFAGRAVVERRGGQVFEVGPGSNLPGLGRVEGIKRADGQVMVVTKNGVIAASIERRRLPRYMPYEDD